MQKTRFNDLEARANESNQVEEKKEFFKNEDRLKDLYDNIKHSNICIIEISEREGRKREGGRKLI